MSLIEPVSPLFPRKQRTIKILLGSCSFVYGSGAQCHCPAGSQVTQADSSPTGGLCDDCGHLLSRHQDYAVPLSRLSSPLDQDISPRTDTVRKLATLLDENRVVLVRGTPSSGKTILARLLERHYIKIGQPVKVITGWHDAPDAITRPVHQDRGAGNSYVYLDELLQANTVFIVDEAQASYSDHGLWLCPIKSQSSGVDGPRICLFSSYGSASNGFPNYFGGQTPVYFSPSQRISITKFPGPDAADVSLFYDEDEFQDVVNRLCSRFTTTFDMDASARAYLYSMTNGHPGAVEALVSYIFKSYKQGLEHRIIQRITAEVLGELLYDEARVFKGVRNSSVFKSFPLPKQLTETAVNVLRKVLKDGSVPCNLQDEGTRICYERGWLHSDYIETSGSGDPSTLCFLPTRLHAKFVEYYLHVSQLKPFPFDQFSCLADLCEAILRRFSRERLLSNPGAKQSRGNFFQPPEAPFQDEWYRAFSSLVGHGVGISSKWSPQDNGRVDFRIIGPAWGVEVLRDGDQLSEVCDRFQENGRYHPLIADARLKDWLILDCRHSRPQKYHVPGTKLWRVVFKEDYSSAYVLGCDNSLIVSEFPLLG